MGNDESLNVASGGYAISGRSYEEATVKALMTERDAALAKAAEWESRARREADLRADSDASYGTVLAKAEAAFAEGVKHGAYVVKGDALDTLRARIEALADEWGHHEHGYALRALLTPPKVETALDVLSKVQENMARGSYHPELVADMAKLRKLLEAKEGGK